MSIVIKNGILVTMNTRREVLNADLLLEGNRITGIGSFDNAEQVIDASGMLVIPGLIQSHVHLCQALFRGMADDMELMDWLKLRIWPLEASHDQESLYYSSLLGCAELLRGGTTAIIDMATVHYTEAVFTAVKQAGIRYLGGKCMMDCGVGVPAALTEDIETSLQESMDLYQKWDGEFQGRIRYAFAPRFAVSCTDELLKQVSRLAQQHKIPVHTHAAENRSEIETVERERGLRNILYLDQIGLCNERLILAHCIHINKEEIQVLAQTGTNIAHCPASNLKLASGIALIPELLQKGAKVSLGADGPPCNNNMSMFGEMRMAALIQKPFYGPTIMPAQQVVELATLGGAKAMGLEKEIGSLEVGKKADVAVVDLNRWHTWPQSAAGVYAHLVYQAQAQDVYAAIVDGKMVMKDGQVLSVDESDVKRKSEQALARVCKRAGLR